MDRGPQGADRPGEWGPCESPQEQEVVDHSLGNHQGEEEGQESESLTHLIYPPGRSLCQSRMWCLYSEAWKTQVLGVLLMPVSTDHWTRSQTAKPHASMGPRTQASATEVLSLGSQDVTYMLPNIGQL